MTKDDMETTPQSELANLRRRVAELEAALNEKSRNPEPPPNGAYERLLALSPVPVFLEYEGRVVFVNDAAAGVLGARSEDFLGRSPLEFIHPDLHVQADERVRNAICSGEAAPLVEQRLRRRDGTEIDIEAAGWPVPYDRGSAFLVSFVDITVRKRLEASLRESEERFRAIVSQAIAGIAQTDLTGRFKMVNDRFCALTGRSRSELLSVRMQDITHPEDLPLNMGLFQRAIATSEPFVIEKRYVRADGSSVWVLNSVSLVRDATGRPEGIVAVVHDITARRRAEQELREAHQRFDAVIAASPLPIAALTHEGNVTLWNPAAERVFGWTADEVVGRQLPFIPADKQEEHRAMRARDLTGEGFTNREITRRRKDGTPIDLSVSTAPLKDPAGQVVGIMSVYMDVTERRRMEHELRESEAKFRGLVEQSPIATHVISLDGRVVLTNKAWERLFGVTAEQIGDSNIFDDPQLAERGILPHLLRARAGEAVQIPEIPFVPDRGERQGETLWVRTAAYPVHDESGKVREIVLVQEDVTERHRAQTALRESEERYRYLTEATAAIVWNTPASGQFESAQPRWSAFTGQHFEQLRGWGWLDAVHPEDQANTRAVWSHAVANRTLYEVEHRLRRHDGEYRSMSARAVPIPNDNGSVREWIGVHTDVTDRKRAEQALAEQLRLTEAITDNASVALFITDERQECVFMNPAAEKLTGYTLDEVRGCALHDVIHHTRPDGTPYPLHECPIDRALPEDNPMRGEEVFVHKDGSFYPVAYTASPIREGTGVIGTVVEVQDISDRKRMESALRTSEERLQQVFAQAPLAVAVLRGSNMVFELANPQYQEFFPGRQLPGRPLREAIPELEESLLNILNGVLASGEPFVGNEYLIPLDRDRDGIAEDYWFTFVYQPLKEVEGSVSGIVAVAVDVTTHVRARRGLERANRELEEFAYVASHDLQEPLRIVNLYTQLLLRRGLVANPDAEQYAEIIGSGVLRMEQLIRDLLSYSRAVHTEELPTARTDLSDSLSHALETLDSRIREVGANIAAGPLPRVLGDNTQLALVFQNLLSNSLKYYKPEVAPNIEISAEREGDRWVVSVRDNGIGFDQQYASRIFGLFKRLHKDEYPGTGLGLAICQRIIERYGGRMWAEGRKGEGATFYFALPGGEDR